MTTARYGIDAPGVIRNLLLGAAAAAIACAIWPHVLAASCLSRISAMPANTRARCARRECRGRSRLVNPLLMFPFAWRIEARAP